MLQGSSDSDRSDGPMNPFGEQDLSAVTAASSPHGRGLRPTDARWNRSAVAALPCNVNPAASGRNRGISHPRRGTSSWRAAPFLSQQSSHPCVLLRERGATDWTSFLNTLPPVWNLPARLLVRARGSAMRIKGIAGAAVRVQRRFQARPVPQPEKWSAQPQPWSLPQKKGEHRWPVRVSNMRGTGRAAALPHPDTPDHMIRKGAVTQNIPSASALSATGRHRQTADRPRHARLKETAHVPGQ